ncbi:MAG: succinylglutamate desuccinylase/aspartoacylase family protein [Sumerlaeia bacterium]
MPRIVKTHLPRAIGTFTSDSSQGPTVLLVGGMHGNEPAGIVAIQRVLEQLPARAESFRGRVTGLIGNCRATAQGVRYVSSDLNRLFLPESIRIIRNKPVLPPESAGAETCEIHEFTDAVGTVLAERPPGRLYVLDLHTSSAPSVPFLIARQTANNRRLAEALGFPAVTGFEGHLKGVFGMTFDSAFELSARNCACLVVESGQHDSSEALTYAIAAIWLTLAAAGCVPAEDAAVERSRLLVSRLPGDLPRRLRLTDRYAIKPEAGFAMRPGFRNFDPVREGQILADNRYGAITSPRDGLILMPLYQAQGEDGFFIVQEE